MAHSPSQPTGIDAAVLWSERLLGYRFSPEHPMSPDRLGLTMSLASELGVLDGITLLDPPAATDAELERIHVPRYLEAVKRASSSSDPDPTAQLVYGLGTEDNPTFAGMHDAGAVLTGATLTAARVIAEDGATRAISLAGGMHHAMAASASGFCVYNDCAVAISWLLDNGFDRIAYLDIDAHHGDGVQKAFYSDPRVLTVSIHQHPATLWPGSGWTTEIGAGAAEGTAVNIPVMPGTSDELWLRAFHAIVPSAVAAFRPQLIVSQCGVDSHVEDPLTDLSLTIDGQRRAMATMRDLAVQHAQGRWLVLGGGGYGVYRVVPRIWTHLLALVLGRDLDPATAVPDAWREQAARMYRASLAEMYSPAEAAHYGDLVLPETMTDGGRDEFVRWDGVTPTVGDPTAQTRLNRLDSAIVATRKELFPLWGLDWEDPRD